jgi:glycosyltransferase involved in cell wall biosynthesis
VIIPSRDRVDLLSEALGAALAQVGVDHEVIVVDDGSRDGTASYLASLGDPRLRVLSHPASQGVARSRNHALAEARGRWVAFLDDDDLWAPEWLQTGVALGEEHGSGLVYSAFLLLTGNRGVVRAELPTQPEALAHRLLEHNVIGSPSVVLARTDLLRETGGFDERLSALADWDLWIRMIAKASASASPALLVGYTRHEANMHLRDPDGVLDEFHRFAALQNERFGRVLFADDSGFVRWIAEDLRWAGRFRLAARWYARLALQTRRPGDIARAVYYGVRRSPYPDDELKVGPPWIARHARSARTTAPASDHR